MAMIPHNTEEKGDFESVVDSDVDTLLGYGPPHQSPRQMSSPLMCFVLGFVVSGIVLSLGFGLLTHLNKISVCAAASSVWSPVNKDVDINYSLVRYNGRFKTENIYRQDAGPAVDAAWEALGIKLWPVRISEEEAEKAGLTHSHVRINKKYGGGYPVNMEGLHHLHCLNLLRQSTYFNYDYYTTLGQGAFLNKDKILKLHVTHCYDILRQQLMCQTDTGMLGRVWYNQSSPTPFVDFNTQHKCKNFDAIVQWARDHQMPYDPENSPDDFLASPAEGDVVLPAMP